MHVTHLTNFVSIRAGGLYTSVRELSFAERRLGVDVSVVANWDKDTDVKAGPWLELAPHVCRSPQAFGIHFGNTMRRELRQLAPDLVHSHGLWLRNSAHLHALHRSSKLPYIVSPRGMLDPWAVQNSGWKKKIAGMWFENANLRDCSCLHALCHSEAESMRQYGLKNPIAVIPNGIDLPSPVEGDTISPWCGEGRRALLFLGRIHPKKGLPLLLDAWAALKLENPKIAEEWFLAIGGWSEIGHIEKLQQQADSLDISKDVRFLGSLYGEQKDAALRNASAYVLPSYSEGLPMSVLEAWSYKLPSLITPECNLPEGFAVAATLRIETTTVGVQDGLRDLFSMSEQERASLGARAYDLVSEQFTWSQIAKQTVSVYDWLLSGGNAPECVRFYE